MLQTVVQYLFFYMGLAHASGVNSSIIEGMNVFVAVLVADGAIMIVFGLAFGGRMDHFTPAGVGILLWLAFVSAVAYSLWGMLLKYNPVSKVAVFGFMNPVFGVILSAIFLKEGDSVGIAAIGSLALVCLRIYICNTAKK